MRPSILFLALISFSLCAQSNWQPGFIIQNGVKTAGEIDDRDWPYVISNFRFRPSSTEEVIVFKPSDQVSFEVGGHRFIGKKVSYITNSRKLKFITKDTVLNRETGWAFLRQYYGGELNLYQFIDQLGKRHFYLQRNDEPLEYLEYELRLRSEFDKKIVRYLDNYKYQLTKVLNDCPEVSSQVAATPYKLKSLSNVIDAWYECLNIQPEYVAKVNEGEIGVGGLLTYLQTTATANTMESDGGEITHEADLGVAPGISLRYVFPGARRKYTMKAEVLYHSFDKVARLNTFQESSRTSTIRREFSASVIQFNLLAEVLLRTGKISAYAEGGISSSYLLDSDQNQMQIFTAMDGAQFSIDQDLNIQSNMKNSIGWLVGVGVRRGPFQLGARVSRLARLKGSGGIGFYRAGMIAGYWF